MDGLCQDWGKRRKGEQCGNPDAIKPTKNVTLWWLKLWWSAWRRTDVRLPVCRYGTYKWKQKNGDDMFTLELTNNHFTFSDSIMSFDRSGFTSLSELDTSTSSLNTISSSLYSFSNNSLKLVQSHDLDLTLTSETVDESDQTYEDILKRNIRFWKIGLQTWDFFFFFLLAE